MGGIWPKKNPRGQNGARFHPDNSERKVGPPRGKKSEGIERADNRCRLGERLKTFVRPIDHQPVGGTDSGSATKSLWGQADAGGKQTWQRQHQRKLLAVVWRPAISESANRHQRHHSCNHQKKRGLSRRVGVIADTVASEEKVKSGVKQPRITL